MLSHPFYPGAVIVVYLRDSGHEKQELSIPQQEKEVLKWALENDLTILRIYKDSRTATEADRRLGFQELIHDLRNGLQVAGLLIWKFSRFARNIDDAQFFKADLRRRGYEIHSLKDNIPSGPEGRLFESALDWANQRHIEDMREDIRRALHQNAELYGAVPGTPPKGLKREPLTISHHRDGKPRIVSRWVPDPDLIPRIRQAFDLKLSGATGHQILAETRLFTSITSLKTFFVNKIYIGILEYADLVIENYCEPLVDPKIFAAVQELIKNETGNTTTVLSHPRRKAPPDEYLLSGLLYCAYCSAPLNINHTRRGGKIVWTGYTCGNVKRNGTCHAPSLPRQALEDAVLEKIQTTILDPDILTAIQTTAARRTANHQAETQTALTTTKAELAETRRQLTNITNAIKATGHSTTLLKSLAELEKQETTIEQTIIELTEKQSRLPPQLDPTRLNETTQRIKNQLQSGNQALIRRTLQGLIARITVERDGDKILGRIAFYHPAQKKSTPKRGSLTTLRPSAGASPHSQTDIFTIPLEIHLKYKIKPRP